MRQFGFVVMAGLSCLERVDWRQGHGFLSERADALRSLPLPPFRAHLGAVLPVRPGQRAAHGDHVHHVPQLALAGLAESAASELHDGANHVNILLHHLLVVLAGHGVDIHKAGRHHRSHARDAEHKPHLAEHVSRHQAAEPPALGEDLHVAMGDEEHGEAPVSLAHDDLLRPKRLSLEHLHRLPHRALVGVVAQKGHALDEVLVHKKQHLPPQAGAQILQQERLLLKQHG
mmetsp:Transcript_15368/g.29552  ORF Transcript_15368/g.29552 Transcript_15368/m.29552 type:complete len:230 (-) Transcript_15368:1045-1734(-)